MKQIPLRYDFPLFTTDSSIRKLISSDKLRLTDSWSLFQYVVLKCSKNSKEQKFMLTLLEQAKYFYSVADAAPLKSKPLLYYYSFLNLAKLFINLRAYRGSSVEYNHGIEAGTAANFANAKLKVKGMEGSATISINRLFAEELGYNYPGYPFFYNVIDYLKTCVGIHKVYCETYKQQEMFYRVDNFKLYIHSNKLISTAVIKDIPAVVVPQLAAKGYGIDTSVNPYQWREEVTKHPKHICDQNYVDLSKLLRSRGLWYLTTGEEYRTYISAADQPFPPELVIYNIMFYFGSITRYHPYQFDELLTAKEQWMVEVFMQTQPQQFIYGLLSRLLGRYVLADKTANLMV